MNTPLSGLSEGGDASGFFSSNLSEDAGGDSSDLSFELLITCVTSSLTVGSEDVAGAHLAASELTPSPPSLFALVVKWHPSLTLPSC